jgi:hypothetical protein
MTAWEMNHSEAKLLAAFLHELRKRTGGPIWDAPGIEYALGQGRQLADAPDLARAAISAARVPGNRTPAIIAMDGEHWRDKAPSKAEGTYRPPRADEVCRVHQAGYADSCPGCRADELAGDTTPTPEFPARNPRSAAELRAWAERARAEMNRAKEQAE